jgi:hypothetical protein
MSCARQELPIGMPSANRVLSMSPKGGNIVMPSPALGIPMADSTDKT